MPGLAVVGKDTAGGPQAGGGQSFVTAEGALVSVQGDAVVGHGQPPHNAPTMAQGSSFVRINGIPVCIAGNMATCGHPTTGRSWVTVSN